LNERLIMQLDTTFGKCLLVMVAGWGVGHITHPFRTGHRFSPRRVTVTKLETPRPMDRAEWIATFELGSTVILMTEKKWTTSARVQRDQSIHFGEPLFDTNNRKAD
jgi:phosphatidylserine decarboxylase